MTIFAKLVIVDAQEDHMQASVILAYQFLAGSPFKSKSKWKVTYADSAGNKRELCFSEPDSTLMAN